MKSADFQKGKDELEKQKVQLICAQKWFPWPLTLLHYDPAATGPHHLFGERCKHRSCFRIWAGRSSLIWSLAAGVLYLSLSAYHALGIWDAALNMELLDLSESGGWVGGMIIVPRFSYARASLMSVYIFNKSIAKLSDLGNKGRQWSDMGLMKIFTRKGIVWVQGQGNRIVLLDEFNSKSSRGKNA